MTAGSGFSYFEQEIETAEAGNLRGELLALFAYWSEIKSDAVGPAWSEFDWARVPTDLIKWSGVVDVRADPVDFVYRFWGTARTYFETRDMTSHSVRDLRPEVKAEKAFRDYNLVRERKQPIVYHHENVKNFISEGFSYSVLRLPFSSDGREVDAIFAVAEFPPAMLRSAYQFYEYERRKKKSPKP
jgi:hypothetical protein